MKKVNLYSTKSRGSYDDFYNSEKYNTLQDAYEANDYAEANYMRDDMGTLFIEVTYKDKKEVHRCGWQNPVCGPDVMDDNAVIKIVDKLMK